MQPPQCLTFCETRRFAASLVFRLGIGEGKTIFVVAADNPDTAGTLSN